MRESKSKREKRAKARERTCNMRESKRKI